MGLDIALVIALCGPALGKRRVQRFELGGSIVRELAVEIRQQLFEHAVGIVVDIEIIGIREQEALKAVRLAIGDVLQEPVVKMRVCGALAELFGRADLVFLQQGEDLRACCALRQQ